MRYFLLTIVLLMFIITPVSAQDECAFADTWMGAVDGQLPDNVMRYDYQVINGKWNFPSWVEQTGGILLANGGIVTYGFKRPKGEIITDPAIDAEYKERSRVEYVIFFCSLEKSGADNKEHDIRVYLVWQ